MTTPHMQHPDALAKAQEIADQVETGGRHPTSLPAKYVLLVVPVLWALFQLWFASPLPFTLHIGIFNDTEARAIHLAFAIFLSFLSYPMFKGKSVHRIPIYDIIMAFIGAYAASYIYLNYASLADRSGNPTNVDVFTALLGIILLLEATRRALGPTLMIIALIFLSYAYLGPYMPEVISHKGASLQKLMSHQWLTTEGVFGVALGVSTSFVFLFVLLGAMLEKAGAGNYFVRLAFSLLGHMVGGPAKAAVVASGLSGLISGSSIANVVTTGTFTIPLMKKVGFPAHKAGAVEVAASTNGQLTPPIMGAAAFLMVEYVGISYIDVIRHAILPAIISYIALFYIVHLEAKKAGMKGIPPRYKTPFAQKMLGFLTAFISVAALSAFIYYGMGWTKSFMGEASFYIWSGITLVGYVALVRYAAPYAHFNDEVLGDNLEYLPEILPTLKSGLYFLLPIFVLVWCLTVERFSPGLSAFYATCFMMFIVITHRPLIAFFNKNKQLGISVLEGLYELVLGLATGSRNMIAIGVATAAAGIVVGTVTLTGIGLVMTELVEIVSGGNLMLMLLFTALMSLILGMGLPTTANYIVVSTLMAPVIVTLGAQHGLIVPLIAVHMFVFYFGILADDTPPVGLAAYAAAAIAKSDPIKTGIQGFGYDIRTAILPFMFLFNTELLLIGIHSWFELIVTIVTATTAMLLFSAATQRYWLVKTKWYEVILLLLLTFTFFRPGYWWDQIYPPLNSVNPTEIYNVIDDVVPPSNPFLLQVSGETFDGKLVSKTIQISLSGHGTAKEQLDEFGLVLENKGDNVVVDMINFASPAEKLGVAYGWVINKVEVYQPRPSEDWVFVPAFGLLLLLYMGQRKRLRKEESLEATT